MISKKYRLREREVKKVLTRGKPFFSYGLVLNYSKNNLNLNRFAIVIGGKSVKNNVERNIFRRMFYNFVEYKTGILNNQNGIDYVFVVKKQIKLDKNDKDLIISFEKDIKFLLHKI